MGSQPDIQLESGGLTIFFRSPPSLASFPALADSSAPDGTTTRSSSSPLVVGVTATSLVMTMP